MGILDKIIETKKEEVAQLKKETTEAQLKKENCRTCPLPGFQKGVDKQRLQHYRGSQVRLTITRPAGH